MVSSHNTHPGRRPRTCPYCRMSDAPNRQMPQKLRSSKGTTQIQQPRQEYSRFTETEKAKFQTSSTHNDDRNFIRHNSVEKFSPDLVHPTKSDTSSVSDSIISERREEIAEDVPAPAEDIPAPAPAPTLETVEEQQPYTPGSRKSMRKNFGKPASAYSDFYM